MTEDVEAAFAQGFAGNRALPPVKDVMPAIGSKTPTDMPNMANFNAAHEALKMTPEEQALYQRHIDNLNAGGVKNADGSTSTLFQTSFEQNGKTYNIPTVWRMGDGKPVIVSPQQAIKLANMEGIDKFPSYSSADAAEARYEAMHKFMERDTALPTEPAGRAANGRTFEQ